MRKDIYIVSVRNLSTDEVRISGQGYETLEQAIRFIESRLEKPTKQAYILAWKTQTLEYQIHIIKVGV